MLKYVLLYADVFNDFRLAEFESIVSSYGLKIKQDESSYEETSSLKEMFNRSFFIVVQCDSADDIKLFASRSVLLRWVLELPFVSNTFDGLIDQLNTYECAEGIKKVKIEVKSYQKKLSQPQRVEKIEKLLNKFDNCEVDLKNPDFVFWLLIDYSEEVKWCKYVFGRFFLEGMTKLGTLYSIKTRKYIGNTTMDPLLSFLMVNQSQVKPGDLVYDPYCGTGGILLAAAYFGAIIFGTDVNYKVIHGSGKSSRDKVEFWSDKENVKYNFYHHNTVQQILDLVVTDCGKFPIIDRFKFDCIITDPPYGIRECVVEKGHRNKNLKKGVSEAIMNLYKIANKYLKNGGFLVFWIPFLRQTDNMEELLEKIKSDNYVINNYSVQKLNAKFSRILMTMKKIGENSNDISQNEMMQLNKNFRTLYFGKNHI